MKNFDFELEPGKELKEKKFKKNNPEISVITPYYNGKKYIEQTVKSVLNQTYPYFEMLIIDDGSTDEESLKKLEEIEKLDERITVIHKQNEGLSATRDYGASKASKNTKYFMFIDDDDLVEPTFLECAYWTLETNKDASWAYSDSLGFDGQKYTWNKWFDSEKMKKINDLVVLALIRKEAYFEVNGYELREKAVNEDWNFWLKLIAKGRYPVHMSFYGEWYRRKEQGELARATQNRKRALEIINNTSKTVKKRVTAIQYPKKDYKYELLDEKKSEILVPEKNNNGKINILMIFPWMVTGGADKFNLELVKRLNKDEFNIVIILTEPNVNNLRQEFEQYSTVYDLTSFLNQENWLSFVNYIMEKEQINLIFNTNSTFGYSILPYLKAKNPTIPILDYVHMEEWYYKNGGYARNAAMFESVIDKTLVCNKKTKKVLINHFGKKSEEVQTVYIGVDESKYDPEKYNKKELLEKYNLKENKRKIISYICRITEQKRPYLLLEIIKKVTEKRNDCLFLIVGDGNLLTGIQDEVKKHNLTEYVRFLGNIPETEEIYKISDITINCSIKEGLALTSYESLAMGVPVISSDVGGQAELINNEVGKVVPCLQDETEIYDFKYKDEEILNYVNAIDQILENLDTYKNKCRNRILQQFTLGKMVVNMSNIFKEHSKNPNINKVENGIGLSKNINITKELIVSYLVNEEAKYKYLCEEYERKVYGSICSGEYSGRLAVLKERLWKNPFWRLFIKTPIWKVLRKIARKILK